MVCFGKLFGRSNYIDNALKIIGDTKQYSENDFESFSFSMKVERVYGFLGIFSTVTGKIEKGSLKKGDTVKIMSAKVIDAKVSDLTLLNEGKACLEAVPGDEVDILFLGIRKSRIKPGSYIVR